MLERNASCSQHIHPKTPDQYFPNFRSPWTSFYKSRNMQTVTTSWCFTFCEFLSYIFLSFLQVLTWFTHLPKTELSGTFISSERIQTHLTICLEPIGNIFSETDQHYFSQLSLNNNTITPKICHYTFLSSDLCNTFRGVHKSQFGNHCPGGGGSTGCWSAILLMVYSCTWPDTCDVGRWWGISRLGRIHKFLAFKHDKYKTVYLFFIWHWVTSALYKDSVSLIYDIQKQNNT
jgi:hypothetical protein